MTDILNKITTIYKTLKDLTAQAQEFNRLFTLYLNSLGIDTQPPGPASYNDTDNPEPTNN